MARAPTMARRFLGLTLIALGSTLLLLEGLAWPKATLRSPTPTLMVKDAQGGFVGEIGVGADERLGFWAIEQLPPRVAQASINIEDRRFYAHTGVDLRAIGRAIWQNLRSARRLSGASTLAMQTARLQDPGARSYGKKAVETLTALFLVDRYGRDAVLKHYLRLAPYGNNVHGIGYAARRYFDRPVEDLSWAQTAFLCALPQSPGRMNPYTRAGKARAIERARHILRQLSAQQIIAPNAYEQALDELRDLSIPARPIRPRSAIHALIHLDSQIGTTIDPQRDGPILHTGLDIALQSGLQERLRDSVQRWRPRGAGNAAAIVVDVHSWEVKAWVGSTDYFDPENAGSIDFLTSRRHPGSTLKPFIYAYALDQGLIHANSVLTDLDHAADGVGNADNRFLGPLLPRVALANSRNVPAVQLADQIGTESLFELYRDLGLHRSWTSGDSYGLGLAIGGLPVTLSDLVAAYTSLAGDGQRHALRWKRNADNTLSRPIFTPSTAQLLAHFLSDPMARLPTFPRRGFSEFPFPVAIKTGTSPDFRDAWAIAWSEDLLIGVWVGHPDWTPMQGLSGYRAGASLIHELLTDLYPDKREGLSDAAFKAPVNTEAVTLCPLSGLLAGPHCDQHVQEWLPANAIPSGTCTVHTLRRFDSRTGGPVQSNTPASAIASQVVLDLPTKLQEWGSKQRLPLAQPPLEPQKTAHVSIRYPTDGLHLRVDPDMPAGQSSILLQAIVDVPVAELLWLLDGKPLALAPPPYNLRWPLQEGPHRFQVQLPGERQRSKAVTLFVQ